MPLTADQLSAAEAELAAAEQSNPKGIIGGIVKGLAENTTAGRYLLAPLKSVTTEQEKQTARDRYSTLSSIYAAQEARRMAPLREEAAKNQLEASRLDLERTRAGMARDVKEDKRRDVLIQREDVGYQQEQDARRLARLEAVRKTVSEHERNAESETGRDLLGAVSSRDPALAASMTEADKAFLVSSPQNRRLMKLRTAGSLYFNGLKEEAKHYAEANGLKVYSDEAGDEWVEAGEGGPVMLTPDNFDRVWHATAEAAARETSARLAVKKAGNAMGVGRVVANFATKYGTAFRGVSNAMDEAGKILGKASPADVSFLENTGMASSLLSPDTPVAMKAAIVPELDQFIQSISDLGYDVEGLPTGKGGLDPAGDFSKAVVRNRGVGTVEPAGVFLERMIANHPIIKQLNEVGEAQAKADSESRTNALTSQIAAMQASLDATSSKPEPRTIYDPAMDKNIQWGLASDASMKTALENPDIRDILMVLLSKPWPSASSPAAATYRSFMDVLGTNGVHIIPRFQ